MPAGTTPIFPITPASVAAQIATANTARDGTGTVGTILTAGANGTLIDFVRVKAQGNVSDGMIRIFIHDGSNYRLLDEIKVAATTRGATEPVWEFTWFPPTPPGVAPTGLVLKSGYSLRMSTHIGETFNVFAQAGDY
jgi:hypothetical protein